MTAADMIAILDESGFEDTASARKVECINDAVADICSRDPWPFLELSAALTIDSTGKVTSPTDINKVLKIVNTTSGTVLHPIRLDDFTVAYAKALTETGDPVMYFFLGNNMYTYPIKTTATLTCRYMRAHPVVTSSSAEADFLIPARHHRAIVLKALVNLHTGEDDPEAAAVVKAQFDERLITMREDLFKKQYDRPDFLEMPYEDDWYESI